VVVVVLTFTSYKKVITHVTMMCPCLESMASMQRLVGSFNLLTLPKGNKCVLKWTQAGGDRLNSLFLEYSMPCDKAMMPFDVEGGFICNVLLSVEGKGGGGAKWQKK
jgi:hypothetical protein